MCPLCVGEGGSGGLDRWFYLMGGDWLGCGTRRDGLAANNSRGSNLFSLICRISRCSHVAYCPFAALMDLCGIVLERAGVSVVLISTSAGSTCVLVSFSKSVLAIRDSLWTAYVT